MKIPQQIIMTDYYGHYTDDDNLCDVDPPDHDGNSYTENCDDGYHLMIIYMMIITLIIMITLLRIAIYDAVYSPDDEH